MFLFYFILFSININKIEHDCSSGTKYSNINSNNAFDYEISCAKELLQKIDLKDIHVKSISIYNETKVIFKCSPNDDKINLYIFDNPYIKFENDCSFNIINIYNDPIISFLSNNITAKKFRYHNQTRYNYCFNTNSFIYQNNNLIQLQKTANAVKRYNYCYDTLKFNFEYKQFNVKCGDKSLIIKKPIDILNYEIYSIDNDVYITQADFFYNFNQSLGYIFKSIRFYGSINIIFQNPVSYDEPTYWTKKYKEKFSDAELHVYMTIYEEVISEYPNWRRFKIYDDPIFPQGYDTYYYNEPVGELIIIPTNASLAIIISIIVLIVIIIISNFFIALCRGFSD